MAIEKDHLFQILPSVCRVCSPLFSLLKLKNSESLPILLAGLASGASFPRTMMSWSGWEKELLERCTRRGTRRPRSASREANVHFLVLQGIFSESLAFALVFSTWETASQSHTMPYGYVRNIRKCLISYHPKFQCWKWQ